MNIKKNLLILTATALALIFHACSDSFLKDMENYGSYGDEVFDSETQVTNYVNTLYARAIHGYNIPGEQLIGLWTDRNNLTEEYWGTSDFINPSVTDYTSASTVTSLINYFGTPLSTSSSNTPYTRIRNGNILLEGLENSSISETAKNRAIGQVLCLRATQMFDLIRTYGAVPIVTSVLSATVASEDEQLPRSSVTQCVEQILKDLNEAATLLPADWGTDEYGRFTSGAALALKSRVLLTYASPIFNTDWDNPQNERWQAALKATLEAKEALTENRLDGCSNVAEWEEMLSQTGNSFNKEAIIVKLLTSVQGSDNEYNGWENMLRMPSQEGSAGYGVPIELIDAFPMADGSRPTDDVKVANGSMSFFLNRDPRFYRTFGFNGVKWGYNGKLDDVVWAYRWQTANSYGYSGDNLMESPAFVRKMCSTETEVTQNYSYSSVDIYEYRYAELILNLAECYAATGNTGEAVKWLGEIRKRVGIPAGADGSYGIGNLTDRHRALEACLYERRIELAYEGKRFWDVWRWLLYDGGQGDGLQLSSVNTCEALGLQPLNGTQRSGLYVEVKSDLVTGDSDPLEKLRASVSADPDSEDFQSQLLALKEFWECYFEYRAPEPAMDRDNSGEAVYICWRSNYYIYGLSATVLNNNPWLGQTLGWTDQNGDEGIINWQDGEALSVE